MEESDIYTDEVKKVVYIYKEKLPKDYNLVTRIETDDDYWYIVICVEREDFAWRSVDDRLAIALTLEQLRTEIEKTGIKCVIEKDWSG